MEDRPKAAETNVDDSSMNSTRASASMWLVAIALFLAALTAFRLADIYGLLPQIQDWRPE